MWQQVLAWAAVGLAAAYVGWRLVRWFRRTDEPACGCGGQCDNCPVWAQGVIQHPPECGRCPRRDQSPPARLRQ